MHCKFCGFANGEDDHRCLRCGRRIPGTVVAAPAAYSGNNALALAPWAESRSLNDTLNHTLNDTQELPLLQGQTPPAPSFGFGEQKVIPFADIQRQAGRTPTPPPARPVAVAFDPPVKTPAPARRKAAGPPVEQGSLDFIQVPAAPGRTLTSDVPAAIYCARPVATPSHRFFAAIVDVSMILIGFGLFVGATALAGTAMGAPELLGSGRTLLTLLGVSLAILTFFYGMMWPVARRETAGMRVAGLTLITFDGGEVDPQTRAIRFASTWLSIGAGGLGIIWAMADEEKLTWQDHISKTFPTFRESGDSFVKQQR